MSDKAWVRVVTRTSPQVRSILRKLVADAGLKLGRDVDQEIFVAATWLWMETLGPGELAARLAPFVPRAERALGGEPGGEARAGGGEGGGGAGPEEGLAPTILTRKVPPEEARREEERMRSRLEPEAEPDVAQPDDIPPRRGKRGIK